MKKRILCLLLALFFLVTPILDVVTAEEMANDAVEVSIKGKVNYEYDFLYGKNFVFDLYKKGESEPISSGRPDYWGIIDFGTIKINEPGKYVYEIVQRDLGEKNVIYDLEKKEIEINISKNDFGHIESNTIFYGHSPEVDFIRVNEIHSDLSYPVFCIDKYKEVPPNDSKGKEYIAITNPSNEELEEMVTRNLWGEDLSSNLKKAFFYFQKYPNEYEGYIQREIIWALTGAFSPNGGFNLGGYEEDIEKIKNISLPEDYNIVVFSPVEEGHIYQDLAMGYGSSKDEVYSPGRIINENVEFINSYNIKEYEEGKFNTKVSVGEKSGIIDGKNSKKLMLDSSDISNSVTIKDTIEYEGLIPDSKYVIRAKLMEEGVNNPILIKEDSFIANGEKGTYTITLGDIKLKHGKNYEVIYDKFESEDELEFLKIVGNSEDKVHLIDLKKHIIKHNEETVDAQKISVGKLSIQVTKIWEDDNNKDGVRPESVIIKLLANGNDTGKTITLSKENNWIDNFSDLEDIIDGKEVIYTVEEVEVEKGYTSLITGDIINGFIIKNSRESEKINIEGSKTWKDNNDREKKRPETIIVNLLANGKKIKSIEVSKKDKWSWSFNNLDKYDNGKEIIYTISEDKVKDYTSRVDGYDLINTYNGKANKVSNDNTKKSPKTSDDFDLIMNSSILLISIFALYILKKNKELNK